MDVWRLADIDNETIQDPHYPGKAFYTTTAPTAAQSGHAPTQVGDGGVPGMELEQVQDGAHVPMRSSPCT